MTPDNLAYLAQCKEDLRCLLRTLYSNRSVPQPVRDDVIRVVSKTVNQYLEDTFDRKD